MGLTLIESSGTYNVSSIPYRATQVSAVVVVIAIWADVVEVGMPDAVVVVGIIAVVSEKR